MPRIRDGHELLWRNPHDAQLGLSSNQIALERLSLNQQKLLAMLQRGVPEGEFMRQADLTSGLSDATALLERLRPLLQADGSWGVTTSHGSDSAAFGTEDPSESRLTRYFREIVSLSLSGVGSPERAMARRAEATVYLQQLDRTGLLLVRGLAAAGISELISGDYSPVGPGELDALGFSPQSLHRLRLEAAQGWLHGTDTRLSLVKRDSPPERSPDLALLSGQQLVSPQELGRWQGRDVPQLAIIYDVDGVMISPLIQAGRTACLICLEQLRIARDPSWPALASQLLGSRLRFDAAALALTAAGLALRQLLHFIDRPDLEPGELAYGFRIQHDGNLQRISWPKHPGCACSLG